MNERETFKVYMNYLKDVKPKKEDSESLSLTEVQKDLINIEERKEE